MLDPPFRIAQAAVQVGDFKLSNGGFGSLHTEAACCGSAAGAHRSKRKLDGGLRNLQQLGQRPRRNGPYGDPG